MPKQKNSHKILKSVALAGALTATGAVATTAHADTVANSTAATSATTTDQQLANMQSAHAATESAAAASNAAVMSEATTSANSQIADLNSQIQTRQASDAAMQQASQASAIASVNQAATSATAAENASYSQAVASQTAANDAALKSAQSTIVTEQQKNQETAQENADYQNQAGNLDSEHNATLNQLDQALKNNTDGTNFAIQKEISRQKTDQQGAIDRAAKQFDSQISAADTEVGKAQQAVNADQDVVNAKDAANKAAQQAVKNAQDKLSGAQDALKQAENTSNSQTVKINKAQWYQAYNDWYTTGGYKGGAITNTDVQNLVKMRYNDNQYQSNEQDQNETIDPNNLTDIQLKKINTFGANILNQIRTQLGLPTVKVTQGSINFANSIAKNYKNDNWDPAKGHNVKGITTAAKQYGLNAGGNYYECLGGNYNINTMDDLKKMVYNDILGMTLGNVMQNGTGNGNLDGNGGSRIGIEFAHANGLLGYPHDNPQGYAEDFALATNVHGYALDHIITIPTDKAHSYYWTDPAKYDHTAIETSKDDIQKLQAAVATDQQALNDAKTKASTTASELKSAQDKLASDQAKLSQAQAYVTKLRANKESTLKAMVADPMQSPQVKQLQAKLDQARVDHDNGVKYEEAQYAAKAKDLKTKHEAKLAEIAAQPTSLSELQNQLQAKLDTLKAQHEAKLKQIMDDANAKIAKIKNQKVADPEIDKLNAQIAQIKSDLAKKQQELDSQYEALKTKNQAEYDALAKKLHESDKAVVNGNSDQYKTADGKTVVMADGKNAGGSVATTTSVKNAVATSGKETGDVTTVKVEPETSSVEMTREAYKAQQAKLPQTGNTDSAALIALGAIASMFGFGLVAKKRY